MATELQEKMANVQDLIHRRQYYVDLYHLALAEHGMSTASIDQHEHTDAQIVALANDFWLALPDSREIRQEPFFQLCDIAEHIFDGPDEG